MIMIISVPAGAPPGPPPSGTPREPFPARPWRRTHPSRGLGPVLRSFLSPRSLSFEHIRQCRMLQERRARQPSEYSSRGSKQLPEAGVPPSPVFMWQE
eukprot:2954358-Alexandrium_andersonii.AAC.1